MENRPGHPHADGLAAPDELCDLRFLQNFSVLSSHIIFFFSGDIVRFFAQRVRFFGTSAPISNSTGSSLALPAFCEGIPRVGLRPFGARAPLRRNAPVSRYFSHVGTSPRWSACAAETVAGDRKEQTEGLSCTRGAIGSLAIAHKNLKIFMGTL